MKFKNSLKIFVLSVSFCIAAIVPTFAATQDVRVTNFPTSYSVVNTTWDSRLSTLQTTLQSLAANMSQFPSFVSRFGWNGTLSFSQGFELLYNDVHSLATATSQSDILTAFNREFPSGNPSSASLTSKWYMREIASKLGPNSNNPYLLQLVNSNNSIDTYTQHIDSDLHSIDGNVNLMASDVYSILEQDQILNGRMNVNNGRLQSIYSEVAYQSVQWTPKFTNIVSDLNILQEFFADSDTVAQKAAAKAASDEAIDTFTGSGSSAASAYTYSDINDFSSGITDSFQTGVNGSQAISYLSNGRDVMGWFSVDTYNAFHSGESNSNSDSRLMRSQSSYPLLEQYYSDVFSVVGVE